MFYLLNAFRLDGPERALVHQVGFSDVESVRSGVGGVHSNGHLEVHTFYDGVWGCEEIVLNKTDADIYRRDNEDET